MLRQAQHDVLIGIRLFLHDYSTPGTQGPRSRLAESARGRHCSRNHNAPPGKGQGVGFRREGKLFLLEALPGYVGTGANREVVQAAGQAAYAHLALAIVANLLHFVAGQVKHVHRGAGRVGTGG